MSRAGVRADRSSATAGVTVVLPSFNEAAAVGDQVRAVRAVLARHGIAHEIIVVDDGSADATSQRALEAGARVLRHPENRGYGAAIKAGIEAARHSAIVIIDADGTYPSDQIPVLLDLLEEADMAVGARTLRNVHIPWARRPAKWILGWLANRIAGRRIPDLNSGLRAFRSECVRQYFSILSNRFSFTTTVTLALLADDYRVVYHPIEYYRRLGKSKITPRHFMDFMVLVLRMAMLFQPLKVFVPVGGTFLGVGLLKFAFDIVALFRRAPVLEPSLVFQPVLSTSAILLLLLGVQMLLIGMVADGVLRRIAQRNLPLVPSRAIWVRETVAGTEPRPEVPAGVKE
ncbi:MAG TPA: glycosyltransferase family 2 protein [Methylomirabilota bacterium]|nr:glycosyltransferase family 2 protein [Methylomirabilota bacterium]